MGQAKLLSGGNTAIVNSEVIQGYSLYETLKVGTFATKADKAAIAITETGATGQYARMLTPTIGVLFWFTVQSDAGPSESDIYTSYVRAFKVENGAVQLGPTLTYKNTSYNQARILDTLPIADNRLLAVHTYGTSVSGSSYDTATMRNYVAQYFTVNSDLSITVSLELILRSAYSYSYEAIISEGPDGKVYVALSTGGSYDQYGEHYEDYALIIYLLSLGADAPALTTNKAVVERTNYYPVELMAFAVLSDTSAILHYNVNGNDTYAYAVAIALSGNSITVGTSTYLSYSTYGFGYLYSIFNYSASQAIGLIGDGTFAVLLTATSRTKITVPEAIAWIGPAAGLECLTRSGKLGPCNISGTALTIATVRTTLSCEGLAGYTHVLATPEPNSLISLVTALGENRKMYQFSEYFYRMGRTYKETTKRGTTFGITASKLQTTTLGTITTIKEVG